MQTQINVFNTEYHGSRDIITVDPGTLKQDITALATIQSAYKIRLPLYQSLPNLYDPHPIFQGLFVEKVEIQTRGAFATAICDYVGLLTATYSNVQPTYEMTVGLAEVPVATHPDFVTFAGTPSAPLNGAMFECQIQGPNLGVKVFAGGLNGNAPSTVTDNRFYTFSGFQPVLASGQPNLKWGRVESYLDPYVTWKKTEVVQTPQSDLYYVGHIVAPDGPAPGLGGSRNWIYMGMNQTRRANVWQTVKEWRSSGRNGWNSDIYTTIT